MTNRTSKLPRLSWGEVCARRLERHGLLAPFKDTQLPEAIAAMCGAHAQVMTAAELSIGLRTTGATRTTVQDALWVGHSLIKTRGPRGTVHLLPAQDLPMWTGALSAIPPSPSGFPQDAQLTPQQTDEIIEAIASALEDTELTTDELTEALVERVGPWAGELTMPAFQGTWPRWRQVEGTATNRGALCFGPNRGRHVTYTNPRRWLPGFRPANGPTALANLVGRYLHAYGPATSQQFARWLNAPRRWAMELFDSLADELQLIEVEGQLAWVIAGDTSAPSTQPECVHMLPYFDAFVVGSHPRELLFPGVATERALAGGQAGNFPTLLINGIVAGVWHQRRSGKRMDITVEPFGRLTAAQRRALDDQVAHVGEILQGAPQLTIGPVKIGPHA